MNVIDGKEAQEHGLGRKRNIKSNSFVESLEKINELKAQNKENEELKDKRGKRHKSASMHSSQESNSQELVTNTSLTIRRSSKRLSKQ